jgi:HD-GYP domain-containing protein (c-di-GMP phosphodiesterase class II)
MDNINENGNDRKKERLSFRDLSPVTRPPARQERSVSSKTGKSTADTEDRKNLYAAAFRYLSTVFEAVKNQHPFSLEEGLNIVRRMAEYESDEDPLFIQAIHHDSLDHYYIYNSLNVAIYALKITSSLRWSLERRIEAGVGGLFHNIGMALVPESLIYKKEQLGRNEIQVFKEQPVLGSKILESFNGYPWLALCAAQVHERMDGSGYPLGLKGSEIHEYAQVIGLADMYEALIHSRPQGERFLYFSALKEIIRIGKQGFRRDILKAFINVFTFFPPQTYVRLNSNAIGRVIKTYPENPLRPTVEIIFDAQMRSAANRPSFSLSENPLLQIVDSVSAQEVRDTISV